VINKLDVDGVVTCGWINDTAFQRLKSALTVVGGDLALALDQKDT